MTILPTKKCYLIKVFNTKTFSEAYLTSVSEI